MGNFPEPDLTKATAANGKVQKCLQRCEYQSESITISNSRFIP
jgi:hypothetical protein